MYRTAEYGLGLAPVAVVGAASSASKVLTSIFGGGGPPWSKALAARKEVFAQAAQGDPAAVADIQRGAEQCGSKFPEVCAFNRSAWEALQLAQAHGIPVQISSGGHPALLKMRAAAAAQPAKGAGGPVLATIGGLAGDPKIMLLALAGAAIVAITQSRRR